MTTEPQHERLKQLLSREAGQIPWQAHSFQRTAKRVLDIILSSFLLVATGPLFLLLSVLVKITSPGPVLFWQTRLGLGGEPFEMMKFRTMTAGKKHAVDDVGAHDPRLTPIGGFLRASRLDELPQLWHVFTGRLSLVGPRPDVPQNLSLYTEEQLIRFAMPQGCTTWGVVRGGLANDWEVRQDINVEYVWQWSFWLDCRILLRTPLMVLMQKGMVPPETRDE